MISTAAGEDETGVIACHEGRSGGPCMPGGNGGNRTLAGRGLASHVELEDAGNQDDRLWLVPVFEPGELEVLASVDEQAATATITVLHDPVAAAVLAYQKEEGVRTKRWGRFGFGHGATRPQMRDLVQRAIGKTSHWLCLACHWGPGPRM
jgi:hypothetical protein